MICLCKTCLLSLTIEQMGSVKNFPFFNLKNKIMNVVYHKKFGECIVLDMDENNITLTTENAGYKKCVRKIVELYNDECFFEPINKDYNFSKYSLSNEINKDLDQTIRAISNYLIRESQETKHTQKEFYKMVIDSAQHELKLL